MVDADLKSYFDTIPHERLMTLLKERVADGRVLALVESFLRAGVMEEMRGWPATERGTPQGGVISPLLANIYLTRSTLKWPDQGMRWCATPTTSSSSAAATPKLKKPWPRCESG